MKFDSARAFNRLGEQIKEKKSQVVLGLDPDESCGDALNNDKKLFDWARSLIDATADYIVGIKPNRAFWHDFKNARVLSQIMNYTAEIHPDLLRILDVKRGDIANTQQQWAASDIKNFMPDIVTINPYMGNIDTIKPYLEMNANLCVFGLVATSNKDTRVQNLYTAEGLKMYQEMALEIRKADPYRVGFVIGSTKPEAVRDVRAAELEAGYKIDELAPVLAPGYGRQGGQFDFIKYAGRNAVYPISSGLCNPKYLNGKSPKEAVEYWQRIINVMANSDDNFNNYDLKSISERFVGDMRKSGMLWVAEQEDGSDWRKLKSGSMSPLFFNMKALKAEPDMRETITYLLLKVYNAANITCDRVLGVTYGANTMGDDLARALHKPALSIRKETKDHGEGGDYTAPFKAGDKVLVVEDVATSGGSSMETINKLRKDGMVVNDLIVAVDRQQGGKQLLKENGVNLHSVFTQQSVIQKLLPANHPMYNVVMKYLSENVR
ncbi:MAG: orotidine-5'-phosphate decarboxylase [Rickettsiales bacterium]|nr:orotidine-5'-phosphate decarboxylase [Rickettsiales bacterium]